MAILPTDHDIPELLSTLRPDAEWRWSGGAVNDTANLVWDDQVQVEPTEQEFLDEKITISGTFATAEASHDLQRARAIGIQGLDPSALTIPQVVYLVEEFLARFRALDDNGLILPIDQWGTARPPIGDGL